MFRVDSGRTMVGETSQCFNVGDVSRQIVARIGGSEVVVLRYASTMLAHLSYLSSILEL